MVRCWGGCWVDARECARATRMAGEKACFVAGVTVDKTERYYFRDLGRGKKTRHTLINIYIRMHIITYYAYAYVCMCVHVCKCRCVNAYM